MKRFITSDLGLVIYVNPTNVTRCEPCGDDTKIYFVDGSMVIVRGKIELVSTTLEGNNRI